MKLTQAEQEEFSGSPEAQTFRIGLEAGMKRQATKLAYERALWLALGVLATGLAGVLLEGMYERAVLVSFMVASFFYAGLRHGFKRGAEERYDKLMNNPMQQQPIRILERDPTV
jgi:hypothetical protein